MPIYNDRVVCRITIFDRRICPSSHRNLVGKKVKPSAPVPFSSTALSFLPSYLPSNARCFQTK